MSAFSRLSVRQRLLWLILLASILALACVAVAAMSYEATTFRPRTVERMSTEAGVLEEVLSAPLDFGLTDVAERALRKHCANRAVVLAALYDTQALFVSYRRDDADVELPAAPGAAGYQFSGRRMSLWKPLRNNENVVIGHLYLVEELPPLYARLPQYAIMAGAVVLALAVVGVTLITGLRRNVLQPLAALVDTAAHVSRRDDYTVRAAVPREDELGQLARAFNRMLEAVGQREATLRANEERFRSLIENASDVITILNAAGVIRYSSPSIERAAGFTPSELVGRPAIEFIHLEDAPRVLEALQRALASPAVPFTVEYRFRHRNGSWKMLESVGRSVQDLAPDGYIIVNSRDVTESVKLQEQLRQAQKMEALGQLSGGVAHDFNNLLTVVLGHVSMMESHPDLPATLRDSVAEIGKSGERAANLTRQLLAFGRRHALQRADLDLNAVVNEMTRMLTRILGEDIQLHLHYSPEPALVRADPGMMEQALLNLAVNARDAMPQGGQIVVETSTLQMDEAAAALEPEARPGAYVCLSVSDTGSGIPPEIMPRIFEPFFTTKDVGKGTGLGLATVYGIVQQHGGWIKVYSVAGTGTTFRIFLPRLHGTAAEDVHRREIEPARSGSETILVVEDEPALRRLARTILERLGYRVLEASDGPDALSVWHANREEIRLVVTDLVMPNGMTGLELARQLREHEPGLKVIFTSGYSAEIAARDHSLVEGVNFLAKPFSPLTLGRAVRASLDTGGPGADPEDTVRP